MTLPFVIRFDKNVFKAALIISLAGAALIFSVTLIDALFERHLSKLFTNWNLAKVLLPQIELLAIFVIPLLVGSIVRPFSQKKQHLIIQGFLVLLVSSFIYFGVITYLPQLELYPYDERNLSTNSILLIVFVGLNLAIYLPSIFKTEKNS